VSKQKHLAHRAQAVDRQSFSPESFPQRGWRAFTSGRFGEAIELWERALKKHQNVLPALAEACFRRAVLPTTTPEQRLRDLERATALMPDDACYYYHLGLAHHRLGELDTALTAYQMAFDINPRQRGLAFTFALARLEADPNADVSNLAGLSEVEREIVRTLAPLLRGDTSWLKGPTESGSWVKSLLAKLSGTNSTTALWRGLGYLLAGDEAAAQNALNSASQLTPRGEALRHYYLGVIAARRGDYSASVIEWQQARARGLNTPWLRDNLAGVYLPKAIEAAHTGNWRGAIEDSRAALHAHSESADAARVALVALDRLAHGAARAGNWTQAAKYWNEAHQIDNAAGKADTTTRLILQNLAIASEQIEAWEQAAEAWRALLRTKPRSKKAKDSLAEAQWNWIRRHATADLQKAGRLGEAISLLKQKVKSSPNDLAARLELVEALSANEQETAARNELQRILQIDPDHREARLKLAEWHAAREEWYAAETEMKRILEQEPTNQAARKQLAYLMLQRGRSLHRDRRVAAAREVFEQALAFAPNNAEIYIDLGRADLDLRHRDAARQDFEEAYRVGAKQVSTHEQIVRCWAIDRNLTQVKKAIERAERELQPNALFFVHAGLACLETGAAPPDPFGPGPSPTVSQEWEKLGGALIERGVSLQPDDPELLRHIIMDSLEAHSPVALPYAKRLTKLTPDDPEAWLALAYTQLFAQEISESKKSLQQVARLARRQGIRELEQMANQTRRELDSPLLSMAFNLGIPLGTLFDQFGYEEEFEEEDEELFWTPPRRRRRR
jgi:tetratricopeptide (TPR) repeat protein